MKRDLCVLWELDAASQAKLEDLSRAAAGSPFLCTSFHPHITLGCYEGIDDRRLGSYTRRFAKRVKPFPIRFEELGLLNPDLPVCFPAFQGGLKDYYFDFHTGLTAMPTAGRPWRWGCIRPMYPSIPGSARWAAPPKAA